MEKKSMNQTKKCSLGDVYSLGVPTLEMLTGRKPTDELFKDGLNLHSYAIAALADRGMEIVDPNILQESEDNFQVCLVSIIKIGVACSAHSPTDRMKIGDVVVELNKSKKSLHLNSMNSNGFNSL